MSVLQVFIGQPIESLQNLPLLFVSDPLKGSLFAATKGSCWATRNSFPCRRWLVLFSFSSLFSCILLPRFSFAKSFFRLFRCVAWPVRRVTVSSQLDSHANTCMKTKATRARSTIHSWSKQAGKTYNTHTRRGQHWQQLQPCAGTTYGQGLNLCA